MTPQININWTEGASQRFQQVKYFFHDKLNSVTDSAQQVGESWKQTATQATDRAINTVTTNFEQAKNSLEQTLQTAEQIPSSTSTAIQTAISASTGDWLKEHPGILRLLEILGWATNHPIISLIILLFAISIIWSIIKAIVRLIETASWSIVQVPFKLILAVIKLSFLSFTKIGSFTIQKITSDRTTDKLPMLPPADAQLLHNNKQQRLAEIQQRLAQIQQEQHELLQEAAEILASDTINIRSTQNLPIVDEKVLLDTNFRDSQ
ncbi:hypothetical protein QUB80_07805 [Chlorogloeopsis sp. ULAP01]|uniref:hypothetical protein n=1 Tax=Chlorogloeopsis sp. ULAP01 TaxID=3056483 RepID=UPI0025AB21D6|nr:hypothetical protein [Chlorogloeopsis sp. ULAP01]MDM9380609.1 hypothetical protein [Chlorogloeopsis sp. ULAP01]